MANSKTSEKILLKNVRLSFLRLEKPEAFAAGQKAKYQATALLDPSNAEHAEIIKKLRAEAWKLVGEAYGETSEDAATLKAEALDRLPYGLADKHPKKSKYEGYAGMFYVAASNTNPVGIGNRKAEKVIPGEPQFPYSGCYGNVKITLWALLGPQKNKYGPRIGANLVAVQFVKDGQAFGAGPANAEDEFEALEDNSPAVASAGGGDFDDDIPF